MSRRLSLNSIFFLALDGPPDVNFGLGITFGFLSIAANRFCTFNALVCFPELQVQAYTECFEFAPAKSESGTIASPLPSSREERVGAWEGQGGHP